MRNHSKSLSKKLVIEQSCIIAASHYMLLSRPFVYVMKDEKKR